MKLEKLYRDNRRTFIFKVYPYVRQYDIAEDLVQEAFSTALNKFEQYDKKKGSLKGWFTKILFSVLWNYMREIRKRPQMTNIDYLLDSDLLGYEEEPDLREHLLALKNVSHKKILASHLILGYSPKETASAVKTTEANVRKVVQRFREGKKKCLNTTQITGWS